MNISETNNTATAVFQHYACNALENNVLAWGGVEAFAWKRLSHNLKPSFRITQPRALRRGALPFMLVLPM